jgi:hypothetical protein
MQELGFENYAPLVICEQRWEVLPNSSPQNENQSESNSHTPSYFRQEREQEFPTAPPHWTVDNGQLSASGPWSEARRKNHIRGPQCKAISFLPPELHKGALLQMTCQSDPGSCRFWVPELGVSVEFVLVREPLPGSEESHVAELLSRPSSEACPLNNVFKYPPLAQRPCAIHTPLGEPCHSSVYLARVLPIVMCPAIFRGVILLGPDEPTNRYLRPCKRRHQERSATRHAWGELKSLSDSRGNHQPASSKEDLPATKERIPPSGAFVN